MIRFYQVNTAKNIPIVTAGEALKRGAPVTIDYSDNTVDKATTTGECFLVDISANYDGINAMVTPTDGSFEDIASGATCLAVPTLLSESFGTTELTVGTLAKGDPLKAVSGKFVAGVAGDTCVYRYGGTVSDPTGLTMYEVKRVPAVTIA
jgi:hypothetical protein